MITATQSKMARAGLGIGIREFAQMAGVGVSTIQRFENGTGDLSEAKVEELKNVFEASGVLFLPDDGTGIGVRVKEPEKPEPSGE